MEWIKLLDADDRRILDAFFLTMGHQVVVDLAAAEDHAADICRVREGLGVRQDFLEAAAFEEIDIPRNCLGAA